MSQPLAKVTKDLDAPRGPDVVHDIQVEQNWFGQTVRVVLPRNLRCATCEGGGCDRCERAGAVSVRDRECAETVIEVTLPPLPDDQTDLCVRIPEQGGPSKQPDEGRGHLLLRVRVAAQSAAQVSLMVAPPTSIDLSRQALMKRSLVMAVGLVLLFLWLLRFSGWM